MSKKNQLSIVFPVFNEAENINALYERVVEAIDSTKLLFELFFVENGSTDDSLNLIKQLSEKDPRVRYISLSRNFGHQGALYAGLCYAQGDAVITMDADLQHPPALIPQMIKEWMSGFEVVYTTKRNHKMSPLLKTQVRFFYWVISKLSGLKLSFGQSDFRLLDRKAVNALLSISEYKKFLRGMVHWIGYNQKGLEYDVESRHSGQSKFSYWSLISFALDGIISYSNIPLRLMFLVGLIIAAGAFLFALITLVQTILSRMGFGISLPPGWATISIAITFFGGVQLITTGILGEYIGRIYEQTKGLPVFIVKEQSESLAPFGNFQKHHD